MRTQGQMAPHNPTDSWNRTARALHWLMALLILAQGIVGWFAHEMERSPLKVEVMTAHKSLGVTLLLLVMLRLLWRWTHDVPPMPAASSSWQIRAAQVSHATLYLLMITLPLSGWLSASTSIVPWKLWWVIPWPRIASPDEQLHEIAEVLHEGLVWCLAAILALHIAAALYHHFVKRDTVLRRMLWSQP